MCSSTRGPAMVFGDMPHQKDRDVEGFGRAQQQRRGIAHLADTTGGAWPAFHVDRLHGVHNDQGRLHLLDALHDALGDDLGQHEEGVFGDAQPRGTPRDLVGAFLSADIERGAGRLGDIRRHLQQERALADTGVAPYQDNRAGHNPCAQDAV